MMQRVFSSSYDRNTICCNNYLMISIVKAYTIAVAKKKKAMKALIALNQKTLEIEQEIDLYCIYIYLYVLLLSIQIQSCNWRENAILSLNFIAKYSINRHQLSSVIPYDTDLLSFFLLSINLRFDKNKPNVEP